jgi:hypothetical protein
MSRAAISGGLWFAVSYGVSMLLGSGASITDCAVDGGLMAASAVGSDLMHSMLGWEPTGTTSAVMTGAYFAAASKIVRNSDDYLLNGGLAAANDFAVEKFQQAQRDMAQIREMQEAQEE